jgi:splicing factor 3B subunit 1
MSIVEASLICQSLTTCFSLQVGCPNELQMTLQNHNQHEKVQEVSINLIGHIGEYFQLDPCNTCLTDFFFLLADRSAKFVPAQEWMCQWIYFKLLEGSQGIHQAAVNSFSYITKILGPQDVLSVLLTNLRVQE